MAKNMLSQMTSRQKMIIGSMIVVVLIIIWQVMSLFPGTPKTVMTPPPKMAMTGGGGPNANAPMPAGSPSAAPAPAPTAEQALLRQANAVTNDNQFIKMQKATEEKYVGKLNELEELKIQRQIAETNQAISAAKLATVTAEKDISDLLTKPTPPPIPPSAYANQLANPTAGSQIIPVSAPPAVKVEPIVEYSVISVSMQMDKWSAVLGYEGKLYNVGIGDTLPADGSVVVNINRNSVVLKKDGVTRKVNMVSSI